MKQVLYFFIFIFICLILINNINCEELNLNTILNELKQFIILENPSFDKITEEIKKKLGNDFLSQTLIDTLK